MSDTETIEAPTAPAAPEEAPSDEKDEKADIDKENELGTGKPPPEDGLCRNCRNRRKLNRHKLCYPCWVGDEIEQREKKEGREWKPGDPHPAWCGCEGLGEHKNRDGSSRGNN